MKSIGDFLSKFSRLAKDGMATREKISEIIRIETGFTIPTDVISQRKNTLLINTHPVIKSEILLHKEGILSALQKEKISISDIN